MVVGEGMEHKQVRGEPEHAWSQVGTWMTHVCAQVNVEGARLHIRAQQRVGLRFASGTNRFQSILQFMKMSQNMLIIACEPVPQQSNITPAPT